MRRQSSLLNKALEGQVVSFKLYQAQQEQEQDILIEKVMKSKKKKPNSGEAAGENNEDKEEYDINDNSNLFFKASKQVDTKEENFEKLKQLNLKIDQQHLQKKEFSKQNPSKMLGRLSYDSDPFSLQSPLTAGHNPLNKKFGAGKKIKNPISYNYDKSISEESEDFENDSELDQQEKQRNYKLKQFKTQEISELSEPQKDHLQKVNSFKSFKSHSKLENIAPSSQNLLNTITTSDSPLLSLSSNAETIQKIEKKQNFPSPLKLNKIARKDNNQDQKSVIATQLGKDEATNDKNILQTPQKGLSSLTDKQENQVYDSPMAQQKSIEMKGLEYQIKIQTVMDDQISEDKPLSKSNSQSLQQITDNAITKSKKLKTNLMDQVTQKKLELHRSQKSLKQRQNAQGQRPIQFLNSSDFVKLKKQETPSLQVDQPERQKTPQASDRQKSPKVTENEKTPQKIEKVKQHKSLEVQKRPQKIEKEKEVESGEIYQFSFQTQMISAQSRLRERIKPLSVNTKPQPTINLPSIRNEKVQLIEMENISQNKLKLSPILTGSNLVSTNSQKIIDIQQGENGVKYQIKEIITDQNQIDEQNNQEVKKQKKLISKDVN